MAVFFPSVIMLLLLPRSAGGRRGRVVRANGRVVAAIVMQRTGRGRPSDTGDGAQIFVDGPEIVLRHVLKVGPGHDLENISVIGRRKAVCRAWIWRDRCAGRMLVV